MFDRRLKNSVLTGRQVILLMHWQLHPARVQLFYRLIVCKRAWAVKYNSTWTVIFRCTWWTCRRLQTIYSFMWSPYKGSGPLRSLLVSVTMAMNTGKCSKSLVWNYFTQEDQTPASCKVCQKQIKRPTGNTSNWISHLQTKHRREFQEMREAEDHKQTEEEQLKRVNK